MLPVTGLYGHIRNNNLKSAALLAGFLVQFAAFCFALTLVFQGLRVVIFRLPRGTPFSEAFDLILTRTAGTLLDYWAVPFGLGMFWFVISFFFYKQMIARGTGARDIERKHAKDLYNIVENLSITAGLPMPRVQIMETDQLNAYAAGLTPETAVVAVTRGLMETLTRAELEAVIAHELTHIKNRDVRLMVIASIFAGLFTLIGSWLSSWSSSSDGGGTFIVIPRGSSSGSDDEGDNTAGLMAGLVAVVAGLALLGFVHLSALLTSFALSRRREFMADGGAAELTKNPDALISALQKISGHDEMPDVPETMQAMMISTSMDGLLATHPPVEDRISALARFAGGRVRPARPARTGAIRQSAASSTPMPMGAAGFAGARPAFGRRGGGIAG